MIKKVLVANRSEIASRIIRACKELGINSVAIYSEEDSTALYVRKADEAYLVGPGPIEGYMNPYRIIDVAKRVNADAIHPGYGFLAENPEFAKQCKLHNIIFIGPDSDCMKRLGNKLEAKSLAEKLGIPVLPGSKNLESPEESIIAAEKIGYPVIFKSPMGGGGRGMRVARNEKELKKFFPIVRMETKNFFDDDSVYIEKYLENPHHIEFQMLSDSHGKIVHLFERDCSIQRRHQKIIEIAPSLLLNDKTRQKIGECSKMLLNECGYENACTIEYLVDRDMNFYFMEANTRLQVEHTVTEEITGIDIVQEQIKIASGMPLSINQEDVHIHGFAIECRINAENPKNGFLPNTGMITAYYSPGGIGVRIDGTVYKDYIIPEYYDSLLAKLTVRGRSWDETVRRLKRALGEFVIRGIKTTLPYLLEIAMYPDFEKGIFDISFIDSHPGLLNYKQDLLMEDLAAIIGTTVGAYEGL
ncbi:MAG TPA: acetyl-CoA carboxylase biotin carboxylase subunit [bacterium]